MGAKCFNYLHDLALKAYFSLSALAGLDFKVAI
jgi:hypothetical protein